MPSAAAGIIPPSMYMTMAADVKHSQAATPVGPLKENAMNRIVHLALRVDGLEKTTKFYKEVFGFWEAENIEEVTAKIKVLRLHNHKSNGIGPDLLSRIRANLPNIIP